MFGQKANYLLLTVNRGKLVYCERMRNEQYEMITKITVMKLGLTSFYSKTLYQAITT